MDQKNIYIVDDDDAVRESARMFLEAKDFAVRVFRSATQFLEETAGTGADCLVLDVHMPGMNGAELLESLRKRDVAIPVVILTGRLDVEMAARLARSGASAILEKPAESRALLGAIHSALNGRG